MKKLLLLLAVAVAFSLTAVAQDAGQTTQSTTTTKTTTKTKKKAAGEAKEAKEAKGASLTGCLAAGTAPDSWTLNKGKKSYMVSGTDLSQHVGHEVKLTGDWKEKGKSFNATNVEHVSDTCSATATAKGGKMKKEKKAATPPGF